MYVKEFFHLKDETIDLLEEMTPNFGYDGFGEVVFYRTYSRKRYDGKQETWSDVVIRVIQGVMSIRKDWYIKNNIEWDENKWQTLAKRMAISLFKMEWVPPGRGLWAMGTQFIYQRGAMSLYNCGYTFLKSKTLAKDIAWLMDGLMLGVGVGFEAIREELDVFQPGEIYTHIIGDDKESWVHSVELLIDSFLIPGSRTPIFDYSKIRPMGSLIRGFGGKASGPQSLMDLHERIRAFFTRYMDDDDYDVVRLKTDIANCVGVCVVAGNVRRSAEIGLGSIQDEVFLDLKDYEKYPERSMWGWMSNNSGKFECVEDFDMIGEVAKRVPLRGEPGLVNVMNFQFGRIGKKKLSRKDIATGLNPLISAA